MSEEEEVEPEATLKEKIDQVKAQEGIDMEFPEFEDAKYAGRFQKWIDTYERDVALFKEIVANTEAPAPLRRLVAGGLMYLIKQFDLVPDTYKPLGLIDDAMVLRVVCDLSAEHTAELDPKPMKAMFKLANDAEPIKEYLGEEMYRNLENYVRLLPEKPVKGKMADAVVEHESTCKELLDEVDEEMGSFEAKKIDDGPRVERELKSYLKNKLK